MLVKFFKNVNQLVLVFILLVTNGYYSQQHTVTSFSPTSAGLGQTVTITGTNFSSITAVTFNGTNATSFTVVNSTTITAVVGAGTSGSVRVTKTGVGTPIVTRNGFTYTGLPYVTEIITDYGSFWRTTTAANSPIWPDNSHNLLSFTYAGTTFSTGVNDNNLTTNGIVFTPGNFKALPVELNGSTAGTPNLIMAGAKVDGNLSTAIYTHPNIKDMTMQGNVMDGQNGLNLGTGYTNLPSGASSNYFITNINPDKINDNEPDIIVTQIAEPTGTATDTYKFLDASNNVIGNAVSVSLSAIPALGTYRLDLFTVAAGQDFSVGKPNGSWQTNSTRQIRFVGFRLSDMGITASNYQLIKKLNITPSGVSDVAFVAYNANAVDALPVVIIDPVVTNTVVCNAGGGSAVLGVSASAPNGGVLLYSWEESTNNGVSWTTLTNTGVYSNTTTQVMNISTGVAGNQYRCKVTLQNNGYYVYSPIFTLTSVSGSALAGTLNPTSFSACRNATTGTLSLSVNPSGGTGTYSYVWESSATNAAPWTTVTGENSNSFNPPLNVSGDTYYRVKITSGCYNYTSNSAMVRVTGNSITSVTNGSRCTAGAVTLGATADGGTINWYANASGGSSLGTGTSYTTSSISSTTTYFVSTTISGCESSRSSVDAIIANNITLNSSNFSIIYSSNSCGGPSFVSVATSGLPNGTYTFNYSISGANTFSSTASVTIVDGYGSFNTANLTNTGANTLTINSVVINGCTITIASGNTSSISVLGTNPNTSNFSVSVGDGCSNVNSTVTINSSSLTNGVYLVTYNVSGTNSISNATAQVTMASGVGTFSLLGITTYGGSNTLTITKISFLSTPSCFVSLSTASNSFVVNTATTLNSGNDITICASDVDANITTGSFSTNYNALSWSTSGTGTFTNNSTAQALTTTRYTPSAADKTAGSVILTITATANSGCQNQVKSIYFYTNPVSVGGTVSGSAAVCSGTNSTNLTLSGITGSVTKWQFSTVSDFSSGVTDVANTTTSLTATNLTATTYYRAVVTSGVCSSANSSIATVTVSPTSLGGSVAGSATVCSGTNSTTLTLSGNTGSVTRWEWSLVSDFSSGVNTVANTTTSLTATNLTATTYYRAVITSGVCSAMTSSIATVTVNPTSVGGSISGNATVCAGTNNTTLTLTGNTGAITKWQSSSVNDFSAGVTDIANTTSSLNASNLTATTYYRAVVGSGVCATANSSVATVTVDATPVSGTIAGNTSACKGVNSTTLTLTANTGTIQWQSSSNNSTFNNISGETSSTYIASNLNATTFYRVVVSSGVCGSVNSSSFTLTVDNPVTVGAGITSGDYVWKGSGTNSTDSVDWLVPSNWYVINGENFSTASSLPTKETHVFIPSVGACYQANPHIFTSSTPICKNLTILSNGHLTMHTGKLSVAGNWVNNGTFTCGTGEVIFVESGIHTIGGTVSVNAFYDFRINKPANGGTKSVAYLLKQATISGTLTLTSGLFDINVFNIDMDDRPIIGGSNESYVRTSSTGLLKRYIGSAYDNMQSGYVRFPVGRSNFNQARLNNAGTSDKFGVRLFDNITDDAEETSPRTSLPAVERTWIIEEQTVGGSVVDMQLYWNGTVSSRDEEVNSFDYNTAYIAHYDVNSPKWESKGGSAPNGPGYAQQNGITSFSPFSISSRWGLGYVSPLPVELIDFKATCLEDNTVKLDWSTASENNSSYFDVMKSTNGTNWKVLENVLAAGNSTSLLNYHAIDRELSIGNVYYKLKQVDIDGKF
ncbi:MAG: hypothetical protein EBS86_00205, partial [Crocinitomicaceae bacterium]|nr:hypothetical protein [Crocinitomicaceae bacterium]